MRLPSVYWLGLNNSTSLALKAVKIHETGNKNVQITVHAMYYI
jgi:hypothetical protein